jgi:hypothetical protein
MTTTHLRMTTHLFRPDRWLRCKECSCPQSVAFHVVAKEEER